MVYNLSIALGVTAGDLIAVAAKLNPWKGWMLPANPLSRQYRNQALERRDPENKDWDV